jgi:DNA topoisomerase I
MTKSELNDPIIAAETAGLHYCDGSTPGITRRRAGTGFSYVGADGRPVKSRAVLERVRALAIPPAWRDVWICPDADGHLQAHGRDARGRKQYRYHPRWRTVRDQAKYGDIAAFVKVLPRLREKLERDLASPKLDKTKVVAAIVHILEATRIRIGNDEYARSNRSYGLTTLLDRHATIRGATVALRFRGKSGKEHQATILDRRLASIVKRCRDIPGQRLFQYIDEAGDPHPITSTDVNDYLREAMGIPFTAKVFRTWAGTLGAALLLARSERSRSQAHGRRQIKAAIEQVSKTLGNTPAICRSSYVHPVVFDAYLDGSLHDRMRESIAQAMRRRPKRLDVEECAVLHLVVVLGAPPQALPAAA